MTTNVVSFEIKEICEYAKISHNFARQSIKIKTLKVSACLAKDDVVQM
jgi:hypothetical protein